MTIVGNADFPEKWTVFGPIDGADARVADEALRTVPAELTIAGKTFAARQMASTRNQLDLRPLYGEPPYEGPRSCFVFVSIRSDTARQATFGMGADWFFRVWLNGELILDLMADGNGVSPPAINDHCVTARLRSGENILAVHLVSRVVLPARPTLQPVWRGEAGVGHTSRRTRLHRGQFPESPEHVHHRLARRAAVRQHMVPAL
jgi:hypothetical protein